MLLLPSVLDVPIPAGTCTRPRDAHCERGRRGTLVRGSRRAGTNRDTSTELLSRPESVASRSLPREVYRVSGKSKEGKRTQWARPTLLDLVTLGVRIGRARTGPCTGPCALVVVCMPEQQALGEMVCIGDQVDGGVIVADVGHGVCLGAVGVDDPAVYERDASASKEVEFAGMG